MTKTAKDAEGRAVSNTAAAAASDNALVRGDAGALEQTDTGDVSGPLGLALSQETRDALAMELQDALHQIEQGFGELTAPGSIFAMETPFSVIDAITIPDYVDRRTGEEKVKHIFRLELETGPVLLTMQSDARPRRVLASAFAKARALGVRLKAGPFLYQKKRIEGQIEDAFIFKQQKGFRVVQS